MKRAPTLLTSVLLALGAGAAHANALSAPIVTCEHIHLAYSFASPPAADTAYPLSVSNSVCGAATAVGGGGSITFPSSCVSALEIVCARIALNLSTGANPAFTTAGALYYPLVTTPVPNSTLDFATAEAITGFGSGLGSGALNTLCTFTNPTESCAADGAFTWAP